VSPSNAVKCYPCRKVPLNYNRPLPFHGGDTGSTPVRDAKFLSIFAISTDIKQMKRFLMDLSVDGCGHSANLSLVESYVCWLERRHVAAVLRREHDSAKSIHGGILRSWPSTHAVRLDAQYNSLKTFIRLVARLVEFLRLSVSLAGYPTMVQRSYHRRKFPQNWTFLRELIGRRVASRKKSYSDKIWTN
jgi:hypothetical protein